MSKQVSQIVKNLKEMGNAERAAHSQRFFKTGKGEYAEGDIFLGISVPELRMCAKDYREISVEDALELLKSELHEIRLLALFILVAKYSTKNSPDKEIIYHSYLDNTEFVNNWDLVDCSAEHIVGAYLFNGDKRPIYRLAGSKSLWERRIGIMSTFHFIKKNHFADTLAIAEVLLKDKEDLIHKAVGWMLREIGKRDIRIEEDFLGKLYKGMPRTMLRYAIEKFPETERLAYLRGLK
jgi:3-methyladenine DNA glycosylase AlkD